MAWRFFAVLALAFAALASDASAHAVLTHATPADGSRLARPPHELRLEFSETIAPRFRVVRLLDARGRSVAGARARAGGSRGVIVTLPRLSRGAYQVTWEVLAADDGHVTGGALAFGVGTRPIAARATGGPGTAPAPLEASLRWLDLTLLVGLIGALTMSALLGRVPPALAKRPLRRLLAAAAVMAVAGAVLGLVLLARQTERIGATVAPGASVGDVLQTRWGELWLAREALLAALAATALGWRARRGPGGAAPLAGALLVALVVVRALSGHAAGAPHPGLAVVAAAAHVLAAGVWLGGVVAFGVALAAARGDAGTLARACRGTFALVAGAGVAVLAVTGLVAAGAEVASLDALLTTDYGRTLITKSVLVVAAIGLGVANARALRRGSLPRLLRVEAAAGAGVLLAAAVLTASPPAKGPEFAAPRPAVALTLASQAGDLLVTAATRPNRPGPNVFTVMAASSRRPPPAPVQAAALQLTPPGGGPGRTVSLAPLGLGRFAGGAELEAEGRWRMTALITRGGRRVAVPFSWAVAAPDPARPVTYSARPLAPLLDRAAALLAVLLVGSAAAAAVGPRRTRARPIVEEAS